jgi:hypothetical protein
MAIRKNGFGHIARMAPRIYRDGRPTSNAVVLEEFGRRRRPPNEALEPRKHALPGLFSLFDRER